MGASLKRDDNRVPVMGGVSSSDLVTPTASKVDSVTNRLYVTSTTDNPATTVIVQDGTKVTAGTNVSVQLSASSVSCTKVSIYAYSTNSNTVAVGTSTVLAESLSGTKTGRGEQLVPAGATTVFVNDLSKIWIASAVNGDGVSFVAYN